MIPPPEPTRDDFCVPVLAGCALLADSGRLPLVSDVPPGSALVSMGRWDGRPLWTAELSVAPAGLSAFDWDRCLAQLDPARLQPAARAIRMADFRRTRRYCGACAAEMADVEGVPARRCPACDQFEWANPVVAALVAAWRIGPDGRREVVLVRHTYMHTDTWALVGGLLDPAETLEQTARREVIEEVGLEVGELSYVGTEHWGLRGPNILLAVFTAPVLDPHAEPVADNDEIGEARFFPVDALPENRVPAHTIAGRVLRSL